MHIGSDWSRALTYRSLLLSAFEEQGISLLPQTVRKNERGMSATLNGPGNPGKDAVDESEQKGMGQNEKGKKNKEEILRKLLIWVLLELFYTYEDFGFVSGA